MSAPELVVFAGSAGGMKAMRGIFETLESVGSAVACVVLHRSPDHSPLTQVLQTYTAIPLAEPGDSPWSCPRGTITVAPAGYHLLLGAGRSMTTAAHNVVAPYANGPGIRAHLTLDEPVLYSRPSLDVTFTSAAEVTDSVIAVLLSCANDDGAAGCAAVKAAGGRVVLQDPATCEAPVAVNAALRAVVPELVADPVEIGRWLTSALR